MCVQTVLRYGVPDLEFRLQFTDWPQMMVRSALKVAGTCCCMLVTIRCIYFSNTIYPQLGLSSNQSSAH